MARQLDLWAIVDEYILKCMDALIQRPLPTAYKMKYEVKDGSEL